MTSPCSLTTGRRRGIVLVQVVGYALHIGSHLVSLVPVIATDNIQFVAGCSVGAAGQTFLSCCVPFEDTVAGNLAVKNLGQGSKLHIGTIGNEAALIAITALARSESHHIAALQSEGADAVVQFLIRQSHHIATIVLQSEVAALVTLEILLAIDGERFVIPGIRQNHRTVGAIETHLTVHVVLGLGTIDSYMTSQQRANHLRGLHPLYNQHGVGGVLKIHQSLVSKGRITIDDIVHIISHGDGLRYLTHSLFHVGSQSRQHHGCECQG